ncbi:MAG TPA: S41 family peptidase [Blastocatellia bacterium]|nr:S41 family peptidase [Blastocatellia bacterium]
MKRLSALTALFILTLPLAASAREAKLVRYPHYHQGRIAFTYLGDIWTADENGQNVRRLTVHKARDVYPRFSPDGKWIAFSSDRNGNLDVFIIPAEGGAAKQLTFHSADDAVQGWSPDSRSILFASQRGEDFMGKLYTVSIDGGMERNAGADMGVWATYSPDGSRLAINRKGQVYWRKYYRGSYQTDVTVMDIAAKKFTDVTDFNGMDSWPMWSRDGHIYFVSDRDGNGLTNIWRVPEKGGKAEKVSSFMTGDVRWPAMSADGKVIVFEHDFGIWKMDVASKKVTPIRLDIAAETQENLTEVRDFNSQADDYDLAPSGRRIVFSIHGEIFTAPVDEGDLRQITDSAWRDKDPQYSPDGKWIAFISDRSGREEIYVIAADGAGEPQKISDLDALKFSMSWSPDSKELAFTASDNKLRKYSFDTKQTTELASSKYGNISAPQWSPDGKWLAYSKADQTRSNDVYLIPSGGGDERKVTFDSYSDLNPRFSPDGKKLFFVRSEGFGGGGGGQPSAQIYSVALEHQDRDPNDAEERGEQAEQSDQPGDIAARRNAQRNQPPKEVNIDWAGLKRRTRQVTRMPFAVFNYAVAPDSRTIVFVTTEPATTRNVPVIYSIQEDGRRLTRITTGAGGGDEEGGGRGGFGGFGGGISSLNITRDGRTLFFREGSSVYSVPLAPAAAGFAAAAAGRTGEATRRRINFTAKVRIDKPAEWAEMFDDAWRTMKYRFYDPQMHGYNWDAMRVKYQPLVEHVGDRQELLNIINEMIGELNASHTGAAPGPGSREGAVSTVHLGLDLEADDQAGRYKVTHVYEDGPADKDWVKVKSGDYLIAINGKPVKAGDNYWQMLNHRLNRKVEVTFNNKPSEEGAWKARIEPVPVAAFSQLRYERWVKERREMVEKASGGRIGYLHIQAMNQPSLRRFEKELRENRDKEALVIDQRFNGGGNIEQELLAILVQRQYQIWQPRGTEPTGRPFAGYFGPKVVLQNWRSASNAEMFPAGFRALGLGKTIGTPTMGAVIGTGSYSLIDGSTVRTPGVGVFLADQKRTNMENYGVQPDILVENTPEDNLAGKDRQLETAVQELMKEIGATKKSVAKRE